MAPLSHWTLKLEGPTGLTLLEDASGPLLHQQQMPPSGPARVSASYGPVTVEGNFTLSACHQFCSEVLAAAASSASCSSRCRSIYGKCWALNIAQTQSD